MLTLETNLTEEIEKVKTYAEMLEKVKDAEIVVLNTEEVAKILGVSLSTAREFMNRPDFPLIECGKGLKVEKSAFYFYLQERRTEE